MKRYIAFLLSLNLGIAGCSTCFVDMSPSKIEPYLIDDCRKETSK